MHDVTRACVRVGVRGRLSIGKTDSGRFVVVKVGGKAQNESRLIDLKGAKGAEGHAARALVLVQERGGEHRWARGWVDADTPRSSPGRPTLGRPTLARELDETLMMKC
jgi:hypothetical protein